MYIALSAYAKAHRRSLPWAYAVAAKNKQSTRYNESTGLLEIKSDTPPPPLLKRGRRPTAA